MIRFHKGSSGEIVTEKEYYQTLSSCLSNAKDWEGNRKNRQVAVAPAAAAAPGVPMEAQDIGTGDLPQA